MHQCRGGAPKKPGAVRIECMARNGLVSTKVTTTALILAFEGVAKQLDPFIVQGSSNVSGNIFTYFFVIKMYLNKINTVILLVLQMMAFVIVNLRILIMGSTPGMKPM